MYVEIAPRQTGKTTRLIEQLVAKVLKGQTVALVTNTLVNANSIKRKILKEYPGINPHKIITSNVMLKGMTNFVDEFDFIDEKNLFYEESSYYATSLRTELGTIFTRNLYIQYKKECELSEFDKVIIDIHKEINNG